MELLVAFALFIAGLIACLCLDVTMLVPLLFGAAFHDGGRLRRGAARLLCVAAAAVEIAEKP